MAQVRVNDRTYDSTTAEIRMGTTAAEFQKISYGDKLSRERGSSLGSQEIDYTTSGKYEVDAVSVTVEQTIWSQKILPKLPSNGYGSYVFEIVCIYSDLTLGTNKVELKTCRIDGVKENIENGSGPLLCELEISCKQILRDGKSLNRRKGVSVLAEAFGF